MSVIDDYIKQFDLPTRDELERIRRVAKKLLPGCEEIISYQMPTLRYKGKSIIGFAPHKNHIGIYPYSGSVIAKIRELDNYDGTSSAVHDKLDHPLPYELIEKLVLERLKQAGV